MKKCIHCRHYDSRIGGGYCGYHGAWFEDEFTGEKTFHKAIARCYRASDSPDACGPEAKFFEPTFISLALGLHK